MKCVICDRDYVAARVEICPKCFDGIKDSKSNIKEVEEYKKELHDLNNKFMSLELKHRELEVVNEEIAETLKKIKKRLTTKNLRKGNALDEISSDLKYILNLLNADEEEE